MSTPTNPYYQRAFNASGGQLARSAAVRSEYELIQRGFDLIGLQNGAVKYQLSCSDLKSDLTAGLVRGYFRTTERMNLLEVRASVLSASTLGPVRLDVVINGFKALFRPVQIDQGQKSSLTSSVQTQIAFVEVPDDAEVLIDILTPGIGAKGLIATFLGVKVGS